MTGVLPSAARGARKWGRMFTVFAQDALAYRASAVIWMLTDAIPALVMPLVWLASYNGRSDIQGFRPSDMIAYYLILLGITNLVQCHVMWEIAVDIKEGRFASFLIRPFSYCTTQYLGFLAWRILRTALFIPLFIAAAFLFRNSLHWETYHFSAAFFVSVVLGHFVSFFLTYAFGLLALYFVETRSLFNFWYMPMIIFSGQVAPIALFPDKMQRLAEFLPFRYTIALPTEIFLGRITGDAIAKGLLTQVAWIVAAYLIGRVLWNNGLKRFTGVGL